MKLRTRTCSLAVSAACAAAIAPFGAHAAIPAPSSGTLEIWFKAPARGSTVSGVKQLEGCYVNGRGVSRVEFFLDSTRLNTDTVMSDGMSCVLDSTKFSNGAHQLKAVAYDSRGRSYTEVIGINIQNAASGGSTGGSSGGTGSGPSVSFKQPQSGGTLSGVLKDSTLCEVAGSGFNKVVFDLDGRQLNTELGAPWHCSFDTRSFSNGAHTLKATAYSSTGATSVAQVAVNISNGSTAPTTPTTPPPASSGGLSFTSPANGATLSGSSNPCGVSVPSGTTYVRFYRDGAWLNTDAGSPYTCNVSTSGLANGTHKLKAISYNTYNAINGQAEISFNVGTGGSTGGGTANQAPSVSISAPASSAVLSSTASCAASASDSDGSVSRVEFLMGSTVVGSDSSSPYACSFDTRQFANGSYTFTARATDNLGKTTSVSRSVSVQNGTSSGGDTGGGSGSAISSSDIMGTAQAESSFSQQSGYNTQILNQYIDASSIPESGMHAFTLSNGETLRFGKHSDPRNSSRKALAFQVDPKDVTTSGAKRAELKFGNNLEIGKVYWAAMSVYVYDWGTLSTSDNALFGLQQHNGSPKDLAPNFALYTSGNGRTFQVHARGSSSSSPSYGNTTTVKYPAVAIPFGRWADFVFKFKLSPSGGGFLQVWMDGTQIVNHQGILGYVTPGYKDFFKFGYYNWSGSSFASRRKVLLRSPVIVADPTGSKYKPEDLRAYVNAH